MRLCQHEDGPPVSLKATHRNVTLSSWEFEDALQKHVSSTDQVDIRVRTDPHLVDAQRPSVPLETLTGIWEDTLSNPNVCVTVWEPDSDDETTCSCIAPHSTWKRQPMVCAKEDDEDDDIADSVVLPVTWVDLRNAMQLRLSTPAACCHFLRSLLGTSHAATPWGNVTEDLPCVVAVVLSQDTPLLSEFRTGDACPSYFLHSVSQLVLPPDALWWGQAHDLTRSDATLLVYRTIPPREHLSVHHPLADEKLVDGCLWEKYHKHEEGDGDEIKDENVNDDDDEEHYRPVGPPYVSHAQDYPDLLEPLLSHLAVMREEALSIPQWTAWPERQHYRSSATTDDVDGASWTVFPLCHCFPAHIVENRKWIDVTCAHVPKTIDLLNKYLGNTLRTALFSRLDPETTLEAHTGWQDLANHVIRVHIPLVVPPGGLCGTWVDGCVETHEEGRPLCFDDAKVHRAFNYSKQERVVLILDLARPSYLPVGTATGGHTDELDDFIAQLT